MEEKKAGENIIRDFTYVQNANNFSLELVSQVSENKKRANTSAPWSCVLEREGTVFLVSITVLSKCWRCLSLFNAWNWLLGFLFFLPFLVHPLCVTQREVVVRLVVGKGMALFACASCKIRMLEKNWHQDKVWSGPAFPYVAFLFERIAHVPLMVSCFYLCCYNF